MHRTQQPRFFVRALDVTDDGWKCGYRWEVQLLNDHERGGATVEFGPDDEQFQQFLNIDLPSAVISAAKNGLNDYVDGEGQPRQPSFLGG